MDIPGFFEFCKANGTAGVLLIALWGFSKLALPRLDKLLDFYLAREKEQAELKPQLDRIETAAKSQSCRFESGPASPARGTI